MITKGQQAPYLYDVIENPPYRILNDRLPLLFTFALPAMLKFQFALSANGSARSNFHMCSWLWSRRCRLSPARNDSQHRIDIFADS